MFRNNRKIKALAASAAMVLTLSACSGGLTPGFFQSDPEPASVEIFAMDTTMDLSAYGDNAEEAVNAAVQVINNLSSTLSISVADSEICRLNNRESSTVSPETASLLAKAVEMNKSTGGVFDISIEPLMELWGFTTKDYRVPEESEIEETLTHVGPDKFSVDEASSEVTFYDDSARLDLGAIAKGYASDLVAGVFEDYGITSAICSLGGNVIATGSKPDGDDWMIAVANPFDSSSYYAYVYASDCFLVTSGGYKRNFTENGKVYHHILDPSTGYPADSGLASVTIISKNGTEADALSTALYTMGLDRAFDFYNEGLYDFEVLFITDDGSLYVTPGLDGSVISNTDEEVHVLG